MRDEHIHIKRLGQVIVRTEFQPQDFIQIAAAGGDENDRDVELRFEMLDGVQAVHAGQADIEQHQIGRRLVSQSQGGLGVGCGAGAEASLLEVEGQAAAHQGVIIDQQNMFRHKVIICPTGAPTQGILGS